MGSFEVVKQIVESARASENFSRELAGFNKSFQIKPSDANPYYVEIKDSDIKLGTGDFANASATVSATDQALSEIFEGKLDAVRAFMMGKLKVSGDIVSAQKLTGIVSKLRK